MTSGRINQVIILAAEQRLHGQIQSTQPRNIGGAFTIALQNNTGPPNNAGTRASSSLAIEPSITEADLTALSTSILATQNGRFCNPPNTDNGQEDARNSFNSNS